MRTMILVFVITAMTTGPGVAAFGPLRAEGKSEVVHWDLAIVHIDRQCQADPAVVYIDPVGDRWSPEKRYQVLWIAEKNDGDLVIITPKRPEEQDPADARRGSRIARVFQKAYWIPGSKNAVSSGYPKLTAGKGDVAWRYDIEIRDAEGNVICKVDPVICIKDGGVATAPLTKDPVCP